MSKVSSVTAIASCFLVGVQLAGCTRGESLRPLAQALSHAADACLYDVRDHGATFEKSAACSSMSSLAYAYISAGGFQDSTPPHIEVIAQKARATAWMARATSLAGNAQLKIW
jgi:hypothetical protein